MGKEVKVINCKDINGIKPSVRTAVIIILDNIDIPANLARAHGERLISTDDVYVGESSTFWKRYGFFADIVADDISYNEKDIQNQASLEDFNFMYSYRFSKEHAHRIYEYFDQIDASPLIDTVYIASQSGKRAAAVAKFYQLTHGLPLVGDYRHASSVFTKLLDNPLAFDRAIATLKFKSKHPFISKIQNLCRKVLTTSNTTQTVLAHR
ncbi:hypothetical protein REH76_07245 [Photobacterium damselae]